MYRKYLKYIDYLTLTNILVFILVFLLSFTHIRKVNYTRENSLYLPQVDFNNDKIEESLFGTDDYKGFFELSWNYNGTDISDLSNLYIGIGLINKEYFEEGNNYLSKYKCNKDSLISSRVYALQGDAHVEMKKYDEALSYYNKAIDILKSNYVDNTRYILKIVLIYEERGEYKKAFDLLEKSIKDYSKSPDIQKLISEKKRLKIFLNSK